MAVPVVQTVQSPAQPRQRILVTGLNFGFVNGAYFVDPLDDANTMPAAYLQVEDGDSLHLTVPNTLVTDRDYVIELVTLQDEVSINTAGQVHIVPLGATPEPGAPVPTPDPYPLPSDSDSQGLKRLRELTRLELADRPKPFHATVVGDGVTTRYDLPVRHIDGATLIVAKVPYGEQDDPVTLSNPADYTTDEFEGSITLTNPLGVQDILTVTGTRYRFFEPPMLDIFIQAALAEVTLGRMVTTVGASETGFRRYEKFGLMADTLPEVELLPTAIRAKIEALWVLATDASYDIDISEDGAGIPRSERYRQIMQQINMETMRYNEMAQRLNIGLGRLEMANLRRVSRSTGRLVPIYVAKEYDDHSRPIRVLPGIDTGAGAGGTTFIDRRSTTGGNLGY